MNRLFIDKRAKVEVKQKLLYIDDVKVPLNSIDMLFIYKGAEISLQDLTQIAKNDIAILVISSKPKEFIHVQKKYFKNGQLKIHQYKALDFSLEIAKYLLIKKVHNQLKTLRKLKLPLISIDLNTIHQADTIHSLLGLEGTIAKRYFQSYFTFYPLVIAKRERTKHPPLDPVNAMLSYLYTILYYEIASWLIYYGFEPTISYLHQPFREHLSLASDLLEPLRADVDLFVTQLFSSGKLLPSMFEKRGGVFLKQSARRELWSEIKPFLEKIEPKVKREIAILRDIVKNGSSSKHLQEWLSKETL